MEENTPPRGHTRQPPTKTVAELPTTLENVHSLAKGTASQVASLLALERRKLADKAVEKQEREEEKKKVSESTNRMLEIADEVRRTAAELRTDHMPLSRNQRFIAVLTGSSFTASATTLLINIFTEGHAVQLYIAVPLVAICGALLISLARFMWRS